MEKQKANDNDNLTNDSIPTYESENDLPNCTEKRNGNIALVNDSVQLCNDSKWQNLGSAYATSDSVPNCTQKREGETAFILDEYTALICTDGKWNEDEEVEDVVEKPVVNSSSSKANDNANSSSSSKNDSKESSSSKTQDEEKSSSGSSKEPTTGTVTDERDEKTYKTVKIGDRMWFAENLNYDDGFSLCPMNDPLNCEKYGRLYNFENSSLRASVISKVCPSGWTVPDSLDWEDLIAYVSKNNGGEPVGVSLKATTGWYSAGDTVLIEGNGAYYTSQDSTRVGASKGTDRFGFTAYPAGSCWNGSDCYINDDTRFYFENLAEGSSYKLAFDKDDLMYDEDGRYGWISIRCVEDRRLEIDSMPPVATLGSQTWMVKDLSYKGSTDFSSQNPLKACPEGWRLPTESEFMNAASNIGSTFDNGDMTYYTKHLGSWYTNISCDEQSKYTGDCMTSSTYTPHSEIRIRCVQDI